jgi:tyrosine aminotransferase
LKQLNSLVDDRTKAILVNNPSNPCGSVFSKEHMKAILEVAEKRQLPIIADEVYYEMVFPSSGKQFYSFGRVSVNVPVLVVGGIAKRYLVPGWRLGWIQIHDRNGLLAEVRDGLTRLATLILGPNTLVQGVLPQMLKNTPEEFYHETVSKLEANATILADTLGQVPGLKVVKPSGAMYVMLGIDISKFKDIKSDLEFVQKLLAEESVLVLPGSIFQMPNFVRLVLCPTQEKLRCACSRLASFCHNHATC